MTLEAQVVEAALAVRSELPHTESAENFRLDISVYETISLSRVNLGRLSADVASV